jgi:hypothetical protein
VFCRIRSSWHWLLVLLHVSVNSGSSSSSGGFCCRKLLRFSSSSNSSGSTAACGADPLSQRPLHLCSLLSSRRHRCHHCCRQLCGTAAAAVLVRCSVTRPVTRLPVQLLLLLLVHCCHGSSDGCWLQAVGVSWRLG